MENINCKKNESLKKTSIKEYFDVILDYLLKNTNLVEKGSRSFNAGKENEEDIVSRFNNYKNDIEAQKWLKYMGYKVSEIQTINAIVVQGMKHDVEVNIKNINNSEYVENIQAKNVFGDKGYNQIDKRWLSDYVKMFNIPDEIKFLLKLFLGEIKPTKFNTKYKNRTLIYELDEKDQRKLFVWLSDNIDNIFKNIFLGNGGKKPQWLLVTNKTTTKRWKLTSMKDAIQYYKYNKKCIKTKKGSLKLGLVTIQRKGGDNGRESANKMQFMINPLLLFNSNK